jgi:methionyl aminopeptidase
MTSPEIVQEYLNIVAKMNLVGVNTDDLDLMGAELIKKNGAISANLNYQPSWAPAPYPKTVCVSVNNEVAHGITHGYVLQEGDIVSLDIGVLKNGEAADAGRTFPVGKISDSDKELIYVAERCVKNALSVLKNNCTILDISRMIEKTAFRYRMVTNHRCVGHSIDSKMHGELNIPSFVFMQTVAEKMEYFKPLKTGTRICIEPFLTKSDTFGFIDIDGWTIKTRDGKNSAFVEAMVEITEGGFKYLINPFVL